MNRNGRDSGLGYAKELFYNAGIFSEVEMEEFKGTFYKPLPKKDKLFERSFLHMVLFSKSI